MVQILPQRQTQEGFGQLLGRGLGEGISTGAKLAAQALAAQRKRSSKLLEKLPAEARSFVKQMAPGLQREEDFNALLEHAKKYLDQTDSLYEALSLGHQDMQRAGRIKREVDPATGIPVGEEFSLFNPVRQTLSENPAQIAKELPVAGVKLLEDLYGVMSGNPLGAEANQLPENATFGQKAAQRLGGGLYSLFGGGPTQNPFIPKGQSASQSFGERMREGLSPEAKEGAETISDLETFLLPLLGSKVKNIANLTKVKNLLGMKGAQAAEPALAARAAQAAEPLAAEAGALEGRIGKGAPEALERRVARTAPETRLFKTAEQQALRKQQLKLYPKYEAEIAADAEKRAARLSREPGPRALATKEARMAHFEKELPKVQKDYQNAISRVRALENQMATLPANQKEVAQGLMQMAQKELRDAEFALVQTVNNAKTGEARGTLESMRAAAREKMSRIADEAAAGEISALKKADYNPEMIKEAKAVAKKKIPKASKQNDFYTQVHDEYANEYRNRLAQIEKEMERPIKSLAGAQQHHTLQKEADALKKMIAQADAENTIHRHNLALREMHQRKLAADRFGKLAPTSEKGKAGEVARSRIAMQERATEALRSPEAAKKVAGDVVEQAARENPKLASQIRREEESISEHINRIRKEASAQVDQGKIVKTEEQARKFGHRIIRDLKEAVEASKEGPKAFLRTQIGKDFAISLGMQGMQEVLKDLDLAPIPIGVATAILGPGGIRRSGYRVLFSYLFRQMSNKIKKGIYSEALRTNDNEKALRLREKFPRKIIKEAEKEFIGSS